MGLIFRHDTPANLADNIDTLSSKETEILLTKQPSEESKV
jgi:hypothetical protein